MRYDVADLHFLRYPCGDESLVGVLRIAAISDNSHQVSALVSAMDMSEFTIDMLRPYDNIAEHFRTYHPDVLMLSTDSLEIDLFIDLTRELLSEKFNMPMLINIASNRNSDLDSVVHRYLGYYFIKPPFNPQNQARNISKFLLTKVVSRDFYLRKIRSCAMLTLSAMKCDPNSAGFEMIADAVCEIIQNPYRRFDFQKDIYRKIADFTGLSAQAVEARIKNTITDALSKMTEYEKKIAFESYDLKNGVPTIPEFIHSAADITSKPCRKILRNLEDEPFFRTAKKRLRK